MKISTPNTRGYIVHNHPVIKVNPQPISAQPPRPVKSEKKKKA